MTPLKMPLYVRFLTFCLRWIVFAMFKALMKVAAKHGRRPVAPYLEIQFQPHPRAMMLMIKDAFQHVATQETPQVLQ